MYGFSSSLLLDNTDSFYALVGVGLVVDPILHYYNHMIFLLSYAKVCSIWQNVVHA